MIICDMIISSHLWTKAFHPISKLLGFALVKFVSRGCLRPCAPALREWENFYWETPSFVICFVFLFWLTSFFPLDLVFFIKKCLLFLFAFNFRFFNLSNHWKTTNAIFFTSFKLFILFIFFICNWSSLLNLHSLLQFISII